jgi:hypothetical protein
VNEERYRLVANATAKSYKNMAFSKLHYTDQHPGLKLNISVKTLKKTKGFLQRKIMNSAFPSFRIPVKP